MGAFIFYYKNYNCCVFIEMYMYIKFCFDCMVVVSVSAIPIYVSIVMYGLRLFIVVLQELHNLLNVYRNYCECSMKSRCIPTFVLIECCVRYIAICVPIVMYDLRLFIVALQELPCLLNRLHVGFIMSYTCRSL